MKSQKLKRVIVVLLVTAMAVAIPSSFAKYMGEEHFTMSIKKEIYFLFNTSSNTASKVKLPYPGYYAIIAKGGDGANGDSYNGDKSQGYKIEGGFGGVVVGLYQTTEVGQYLFVAPGSAGGRPNPNSKPNVAISNAVHGAGGVNSAHLIDGLFAGGSGSDLGGGVLNALAEAFSKAPASGGGGAATLVYKCDKDGNYTSNDILFVAAGGGAGAVWNEGYRSGAGLTTVLGTADPSGFGGDGGSNFFNGKVSAPITYSGSKYTFSFASIYDGFNGTGMVSSIDTRGKAGTSSGAGAGASSSAGGLGGLLAAQTSSPGLTFANGGKGGASAQYGGGGGAGYNGGGGGVSTSVRNQGWSTTNQPAGGGGGGASYIAPAIIQSKNIDYASIIDSVSTGENCIPAQHPVGDFSADGDGYVIIKYLGPSVSNESNTVMASAMARNIVQKYVNSTSYGVVTNIDTNNAFYKSLMADAAIADFLGSRLWTIDYETCGRLTYSSDIIPVLYFSDQKNQTLSTTSKIEVWRYKEGELGKASGVSVTRTNKGSTWSPSYVYSLNNPSSATYAKADFALS